MKIHFSKLYFVFFLLLFVIEVLIALFIHDDFIRPYIGDVLVVILIYCFLMSFLSVSKIKILVFVLVFSFAIEFFQYFNLVVVLGLEDVKLAKVVLGNSFSGIDLLCYVVGISIVFIIEKLFGNQHS